MTAPTGNDNIRTEHLKCEACGVQVSLASIDLTGDGAEHRTFVCSHCGNSQTLRIVSDDDQAFPERRSRPNGTN